MVLLAAYSAWILTTRGGFVSFQFRFSFLTGERRFLLDQIRSTLSEAAGFIFSQRCDEWVVGDTVNMRVFLKRVCLLCLEPFYVILFFFFFLLLLLHSSFAGDVYIDELVWCIIYHLVTLKHLFHVFLSP